MPFAAAVPAIMTGVSAVAGAFGKKQQTATTPTYTPQQQSLQHQVGDLISTRLNNPTGYVDSMHNSAIGDVNANFSGIEARMKRKLAGQGFGKSGKLGLNTQALEIARGGQLSDLETQFANLQMNYDNSLIDDATRFGFAGGGQTSTTTGGGGIGGAIQGGAETATLLYALNGLLGGGTKTKIGDIVR